MKEEEITICQCNVMMKRRNDIYDMSNDMKYSNEKAKVFSEIILKIILMCNILWRRESEEMCVVKMGSEKKEMKWWKRNENEEEEERRKKWRSNDENNENIQGISIEKCHQ